MGPEKSTIYVYEDCLAQEIAFVEVCAIQQLTSSQWLTKVDATNHKTILMLLDTICARIFSKP